MSPQLLTLDNQPMTWSEAKARAADWWAREGRTPAAEPHAFESPVQMRHAAADNMIGALERMAQVPRGTIRSKRRDATAVELRDAVVLVLRMRGWGVARIAESLTHHHSTIESAARRATLRQDREFIALVETLSEVAA